MKATHVYVKSLKMDGYGKLESREIFKDPATGDGRKKSAKGFLRVNYENGTYVLVNNCTPEEEEGGELKIIFEDGDFMNQITFMEIRSKVDDLVTEYCK